MTIDRPQVAALVGPIIPNAHAVLLQVFDVGVAGQEPKQLVYDRFQMQFLGREQGKPSSSAKRI